MFNNLSYLYLCTFHIQVDIGQTQQLLNIYQSKIHNILDYPCISHNYLGTLLSEQHLGIERDKLPSSHCNNFYRFSISGTLAGISVPYKIEFVWTTINQENKKSKKEYLAACLQVSGQVVGGGGIPQHHFLTTGLDKQSINVLCHLCCHDRKKNVNTFYGA